MVGGLLALLLLGVIAREYLSRLERGFTASLASETQTASLGKVPLETEANETPEEIPEGGPEQEAPGTPSPGFADNFETGLSPAWTVHYGDPFVENGQLTSNIGAGIAAGDASWENYQIDFDVDTSQVECLFTDTSNSVGVRLKDFDHAYWFVFTDCNAAWSPFAGGVNQGSQSFFPDTLVSTQKGKKHITINVDETKMSASENGASLAVITDMNFRTGGIFLQVEAQTYYDNIQVTLLP